MEKERLDPMAPPDLEGASAPGHFEAIGESRAFLDFQERLRRAAPVERSVLLIGERGTGKEMAAQRLHFLSKRWGQPFVTLNCAVLSPTLIESELFGHEQGAFTGAAKRRMGRFEAADGGTLFLDEISLIPIVTQEKILRVVEYGTFERVGGSRPVRANVRIIGATNVNLERETATGRFKRDLLDRLSFEVLFLPPLRERQEDILLLARHFASRMAYELGREEIPEFTSEAAARLLGYGWPGNVRELKNVVERAVYRSDSEQVAEIEFHPFRSPYVPHAKAGAMGIEEEEPASAFGQSESAEREAAPATREPDGRTALPEAVRQLEIAFLRWALERTRYNQRASAEALGLTYHQFRGLYRKHADEIGGE